MKIRSILLILGFVCALGVHAQAVIGSGAVTGTVFDYTHSGVPDTTVVLSNDRLGVHREMDTTDEGVFYSAVLIPGDGYDLKVKRKGYVDLDYKNFQILVGHTLNFQISLTQVPGARRETETASVVVTDVTYELQDTFSSSQLDALPARNRDVYTLAPLTPTATLDSATGQLAFHGEPFTNAILMDGILTTNLFFNSAPPIGPAVPQDAIEQMQVVSTGAPAEFWQAMGGTINVATRSGGSAIHGEGYDYFNSHTLNASDTYAPGFVPPGWRQQFGANAGGPVGERKIFWFANLEDTDAHFEELNHTLNPLLVNPFGTAIEPSNCAATAAQCTTAINFLNAQLNRVVDGSLASLTGLAKVDWRPNDANALTFTADAMHRHSPDGSDNETVASNAGVLGNNGTYTDESRYAKIGYTAVWSGNAVNEFRGGWYHDRLSDYPDADLLPSTHDLGIDIAGTPFGGNPNLPFVLSEGRYQLSDNFTLTAGSNLIKIGFDYSSTDDRNAQILNRFGNYFFPTLTSFADDFSGNTALHKDYSSFSQTFGQPVVDLDTKRLAIYAQDSWRYGRLSVDLGVAWEKTYIPQPTDTNPAFLQTAAIGSPDLDVAPRIGLAYQVDSRTVVRAGLGAYYQPFSGQLLDSLFTGNGIYQVPITVMPTQTPVPVFPAVYASPPGGTTGATDLTYIVSKVRSPVSAQSVLSVERRVGNGLTVSLNYVYNRGINLLTAAEQNLNAATITKTYTIDDAAGNAVSSYTTPIYNVKGNLDFAHVYQVGNAGSSSYNGLAIQVRKKLSHGISAQASYTWSHATDDVSGSPLVAGFIPANTVPGSFRGDEGTSSYNQPNRAVGTWIWQPSFNKSDSMVSRYLINGWQISGSATLASSLPETPVVIVNGQQFTGVTMAFPTTLNGSGGWTRVPFQPVNSLLTGPEYDVDARLTRELPFSERIKARLMFEGFNLFNTQYNTSVNTIAYEATAGVLRPVPGVGTGTGANGFPWGDNARHLQVALRIIF